MFFMLAVNYSTIHENLKAYCNKVTDQQENLLIAACKGHYED